MGKKVLKYGVSIFEKYNEYNKDIVQLSIDTLSPQERIILKKKYGVSYLGNGYILKSEEVTYENVEKKLLKRLKEVDELIKNGENRKQILDYYQKKSSFSYYNSYSNQIANNKLSDSFVQNFPVQYQSIIEKILPKISVEGKNLIAFFYWGHNYDVLKKDIDEKKIKDLKILINKLNDEARKMLQHKVTLSNNNIKKIPKTNTNNNDAKKITNDKKNNCLKKKSTIEKIYIEKDNKIIPKIETEQEIVLKIIDRFKVTNPNYYEVISKKYSGEKFEIKNDVKLTKKEQALIRDSRTKINTLLSNSKKLNIFLSDNSNGFLKSYEEKDHEMVLKIIDRFKITNPNYYEVISKRYSGEKFERKNAVELMNKEYKVLNNAKIKINLLLNDSEKCKIFFGDKSGFLKFFEEKDYEMVLKIIDRFKITNPSYYEVILKKYSGVKLEIENAAELTKEEQTLFYSAKAKINLLLNTPEKYKIFLSDNSNGFLKFYEEKDYETVLKIIDRFKITNSSYYEVISKKYSGEKFERKNAVGLTRQEQIIFNNAKTRINYLLSNNRKLIIFLDEKSEVDITLENYPLKGKIDEKILNLYITNLDKISNECALEVIIQVAKHYPNKIIDIINSNYIKNKLNYLTQKEQAYIYLNLLSYNIPSLTKKKISQILDVEELFLDEYQIMTFNDDVNELNRLIKKQKNR